MQFQHPDLSTECSHWKYLDTKIHELDEHKIGVLILKLLLNSFKNKLAAVCILSVVCTEMCLDLCDPKESCTDSFFCMLR
jgi:hypothetical protein